VQLAAERLGVDERGIGQWRVPLDSETTAGRLK
jgi:hypothetical protein